MTSATFAKHTVKFGVLYKKDYVSDYDRPVVSHLGSEASCTDVLGADFWEYLGIGRFT